MRTFVLIMQIKLMQKTYNFFFKNFIYSISPTYTTKLDILKTY